MRRVSPSIYLATTKLDTYRAADLPNKQHGDEAAISANPPLNANAKAGRAGSLGQPSPSRPQYRPRKNNSGLPAGSARMRSTSPTKMTWSPPS